MTTDPWRRAVAVTIGLLAGLLGGAHDATAQPAPTDRFVVSVDVGWRPASRTFGLPVPGDVGPGPYSFRISISDSGSTRAPFNRRVQCRCGPVTRPVAPA